MSYGLAPVSAVGWTHVWEPGGEQLPLTDGAASILVSFGFIVYSPEDGPNARVYRLCEGVTMDKVKEMLA